MPGLSVIIITRNEAHNIVRCLESVKSLADEIVVVDSMSEDDTVNLCRNYGCKVFQRAFDGYGRQKQFAVDQASSNWVLSIDADEVVSPELQAEIKQLFTATAPEFPGYRIGRTMNFMGRQLKYCDSGKDIHLRLFNRTKGGFKLVTVHEEVELKGNPGKLKGKLIHYSYRDIANHLDKINRYTTLAAEANAARGKHYPGVWVALKFPVSFLTFYFLRLGFLDGYPGLMWSFMASVYSTLKVAKTIEQQQLPKS